MATKTAKTPAAGSIASPRAALSAWRSDTLAQVEELRSQIEQTQEKLALVTDGDVPRQEFAERVNDWIDRQARSFEENALYAVSGLRMHRPERPLFGLVPVRGGQTVGTVAEADCGPLLAWLLGEAIKERLAALIESSTYPEGPPLADRPQLRAELQAALDALELSEESLICQAETAGLTIPRRPDCRPEIVLHLSLVEET